jgi:hypothetical protein
MGYGSNSLDGPSKQGTLSVTDAVVQAAKVEVDPYTSRKVVTLQPTTGKIYVLFGDGDVAAPSAATVAADGFIVFKNAVMTFEATHLQPIYLLAVTGTVTVKVAERA